MFGDMTVAVGQRWRQTTRQGTVVVRRRPAWTSAVRTVGLYLATLYAAVTLVFFLPRLMPGDPLSSLQDPMDSGYVSDPEVRAQVMAYYGLDRPLVEQYGSYLARTARGDLGWSIARNAPVSTLIGDHLPWTLLLMGTALVASSFISFFAGVAAAWRRGSPLERVLLVGMTAARGVPEYAAAAVLLIVFGVLLPVFPLYGAETPFVEYATPFGKVADIARHLALPFTALTLGLVGNKFLLVRNTTIGVLGEDYMVLARAKGLPKRRLEYHHAARNALLPFLTVVGIQTGFAVGGSVFVEAVFAYPGMGTLILKSVAARDYPVLEGCFLTLAAAVLIVNLVLELLYARFDPRAGGR
jgi:peptide/nickel transport system permease protein